MRQQTNYKHNAKRSNLETNEVKKGRMPKKIHNPEPLLLQRIV